MATHSRVLAWRIPGMAEPGGLPSMGSHRVGHNWSDLAAAAAAGIKLIYPYGDAIFFLIIVCMVGFTLQISRLVVLISEYSEINKYMSYISGKKYITRKAGSTWIIHWPYLICFAFCPKAVIWKHDCQHFSRSRREGAGIASSLAPGIPGDWEATGLDHLEKKLTRNKKHKMKRCILTNSMVNIFRTLLKHLIIQPMSFDWHHISGWFNVCDLLNQILPVLHNVYLLWQYIVSSSWNKGKQTAVTRHVSCCSRLAWQ